MRADGKEKPWEKGQQRESQGYSRIRGMRGRWAQTLNIDGRWKGEDQQEWRAARMGGKKVCSEQGTSERREGLCCSGCSHSGCPLLLSQLPHKPTGVPGTCWGPRAESRARIQLGPFCALLPCFCAMSLLWPFLQAVLEPHWAKVFSSNSVLKSHLYERSLVSLVALMKQATLHPSLTSLQSLVLSRLTTCPLLIWLPSVYTGTGVLDEFLGRLASRSRCCEEIWSEGRPFSMQWGSSKIHDNPVYSKQLHLDSG